jgi:hypothetical protein
MTTVLERLTPGHVPLCRGCRHHLPALAWHPTPCSMVAWHEERHYSPTLKRWEGDGSITCSDFEATEAAEPSPIAEGVRA